MPKQTVGAFLFDYIHKKGVKHAFGIPGDFALPTFRWLADSKIKTITMTHEPSVGFAADAYARVNGLGLACVTYCVGGLNMLNAVACAYAEKSPIIVVSGGPSPSERLQDAYIHHKVRTFDTQRRIFEEVTCANTVLNDPATAADEIIRVVETVIRECRPGYIEVPYDLVDKIIKLPSGRYKAEKTTSDQEALSACIEDAVAFINSAKRPVLVAGVELHRHKISDKALAIAEKFNLPIVTDLLSKSALPENHPNYVGVFSGALSDPKCEEYVNGSDCLVLLGTFISDVFMGFQKAKFDRERAILVTTEKTRVALRTYDDIELEEFMDMLLKSKIRVRKEFKNPNPVQKAKPLSVAETKAQLTVPAFFKTLEANMPEGSTICCDVGDALIGAIGIRTSKKHNFLADAYYLSMGFAVPAAIGAMAGKKDGRVFAVVGDGAFQMTGTEISTAAKFSMAPIVLVMNNDGYGTQRHIIDGPFNEIQRWQYHKLPETIGVGKGMKVTTPEELDVALKLALKSKELFLIEAIIPRSSSSDQLRRLGEGLSAQRDVKKK